MGPACLRIALVAGVLGLAACQVAPPQPTAARYPPNLYGMSGDDGAVLFAEWAFADTKRIHDDPADAAKAVASVDYLAGALADSPRWTGLSLRAKQQMQAARTELRRLLGIPENAPSQLVVDSLMHSAVALERHDVSVAMAFLTPPAFTLSPPRTLQILSNLPSIPAANQATLAAAQELNGSDDEAPSR